MSVADGTTHAQKLYPCGSFLLLALSSLELVNTLAKHTHAQHIHTCAHAPALHLTHTSTHVHACLQGGSSTAVPLHKQLHVDIGFTATIFAPKDVDLEGWEYPQAHTEQQRHDIGSTSNWGQMQLLARCGNHFLPVRIICGEVQALDPEVAVREVQVRVCISGYVRVFVCLYVCVRLFCTCVRIHTHTHINTSTCSTPSRAHRHVCRCPWTLPTPSPVAECPLSFGTLHPFLPTTTVIRVQA